MDHLTQQYLQDILNYIPETGQFFWKRPGGSRAFGKEAGCVYPNGYHHIQIDGIAHRTARLAWLYVTGTLPKKFIDHINGDKSDNRWGNLREASDGQNQLNRGLPVNNRSGIKGVRFEEARQKWRAQIVVDNVAINLGRFSTQEAAKEARYQAEVKYFGVEFARRQ